MSKARGVHRDHTNRGVLLDTHKPIRARGTYERTKPAHSAALGAYPDTQTNNTRTRARAGKCPLCGYIWEAVEHRACRRKVWA